MQSTLRPLRGRAFHSELVHEEQPNQFRLQGAETWRERNFTFDLQRRSR